MVGDERVGGGRVSVIFVGELNPLNGLLSTYTVVPLTATPE